MLIKYANGIAIVSTSQSVRGESSVNECIAWDRLDAKMGCKQKMLGYLSRILTALSSSKLPVLWGPLLQWHLGHFYRLPRHRSCVLVRSRSFPFSSGC